MDHGRDGTTQPDGPSAPGAPTESRRDALGTIAIGAGSCAVLTAAAPLAAALLAPATAAAPDEEAPYLDAGAEADVRVDQPVRVELHALARDGWLSTERELGAAWLVRSDMGVQAFSATCPHLGCSLEKDVSGFFCPCHDSRFDTHGSKKSGPSPRPMDPMPIKIDKGRVLVQAVRYVPGSKERKLVGSSE